MAFKNVYMTRSGQWHIWPKTEIFICALGALSHLKISTQVVKEKHRRNLRKYFAMFSILSRCIIGKKKNNNRRVGQRFEWEITDLNIIEEVFFLFAFVLFPKVTGLNKWRLYRYQTRFIAFQRVIAKILDFLKSFLKFIVNKKKNKKKTKKKL